MKRRLSIIAFAGTAAVALFVSACSTTFRSPYDLHGLEVNRPVFDVRAIRQPDSTIRLSFVAPSRIRTKDPIIRWVDAAVGPDDKHLLDTITFSTSQTGEKGKSINSMVIGQGLWDTRTAKKSKTVVADIGVVTSSDHLVFRQYLEIQNAQALEMEPFARRTPNGAEIGVMAQRMYSPAGEYLPTSENFRVIISDTKGNVVWRSDYNANFAMALGTVQPMVINSIQQFFIEWDGIDQNGNPVSEGTYNIEYIIPAKPTAYTQRSKIEWPVR